MNLQNEREEIEEKLNKLTYAKDKFINYGQIEESSLSIDDRLELRGLILHFLDKRISEDRENKEQIEVDLGVLKR